ncbi:MAG TPA: NAD(P)-dependent oxidoreductase [Burkholderiaceae bacterium]|nr:NAD(P)-dependent oxidoreductase [Burkholderiaceae bacterium]
MEKARFNIGFIGAGNMGRPMINHLVHAGHHLTAFARRTQTIDALNGEGVMVVDSPAQAAAHADFIIINVTNTFDVEEVLFAPHGVIHQARVDSVVIDHSTISARATREFAHRLSASHIHFLDAPVSGGVNGARAASLTIMVGGRENVFERARPILNVYGRVMTYVGGHGCGQVAKACNQIVQVVNIQGIAEAMLFAQIQGVAPDRLLEAISPGFAGSRMLDLMGPKMAKRDFSAGIEARLHDKDFSLIAELADELNLHLPAMRVVAQQLRALVKAGWGYDDTSSLLRVLEQAHS